MDVADWTSRRISDWLDLPEEPPDEETQQDLIARYQNHRDKGALRELVRSNLPFVVDLTKRFGSNEDRPELIQAGVIGIAKAAEKYEPSRGVKFLSYAKFWIKNEFHSVHKQKYCVKISARACRKVYGKYQEVRDTLIQKGEDPSAQRIAEEIGVDPVDVSRTLSARFPVRLNQSALEEGKSRLEMMPGDLPDPFEAPEEKSKENKRRALLKDFADSLDDARLRAIWFERMTAMEPKTLRELGDEWGVSKERIRQQELTISADLKEWVEDRTATIEEII